MAIYVTDCGDFSTRIIDGFEISDDGIENPKGFGKYCVIGSISDEHIQIHKFGVVFENEYISKEHFCKKLDKKIKRDSLLVLRLMDESGKNFIPFGEKNEEDLTITAIIRDIK